MKLRLLITIAIGAIFSSQSYAQSASVCPDNFDAYAGTSDPVPCICSAEATKNGSVWGMDVYSGDSAVCRAALHAGVVGQNGGAVTVIPEPGRSAYPGVTRNGVRSSNNGAYRSSFRFAGTAQPAASATPSTPVAAAGGPSICPDNFDAYAGTRDPVPCTCSAEATKNGSVWGMDVYSGDSAVCRAALHAGVVGPNGGAVTVIPEPGRNAYPGVTRNGVRSSNNAAYRSSFRFAGTAQPAAAATPSTPVAAATGPSICPDNFDAYAGTRDPVPCTCSAEATKNGSVWGMDVYSGDSAVCRAALHAGVVGQNGGAVTVIPEPGRNAYPGVTRNGVRSSNNGTYRSSFRFAGAAQRAAAAPPSTPVAAANGPSICPDNFDAYAGTSDPVPCTCSAEATKDGSVWGMDVYSGDSAVCRAALHAGVVGSNGGAVTVIPEPGRNAYPGVTRNGVRSSNNGTYRSSFRFAAAMQPVMINQQPAQQPIAATIQATGQVQLYIQFRFNSAELDESALPTLSELRDTLTSTPGLRLTLVGHTDAVGTQQYNQALSLRRAQSVMRWLATQGVTPTRLAAEGKGQDQPIADNGTDSGRALNRRVQALRLQ